MARLVSKVYGEALFDFAKGSNSLDKMYENALDIINVFNINGEVLDFLLNPKITDDQKIEFLNTLFSKLDNKKILEFLSIIIKKGRQKEIVPILKHFTHLTLKDKNIGEATVFSAKELTDTQKNALEQKLISTTSFDKFIVDYNVDESLIAGLKIKIDDKVIDTTYKTKIFDISKSLRGLKLWLI